MWLDAWMGFALRILLVLGAIFSIYQYASARQDKRIERSLELVDLWEQKDYQNAQTALGQRLGELEAKYGQQFGANPSPEQVASLPKLVGNAVMTPQGGSMPLDEFQPQFESIVYFLNRVGSCTTSGLCERGVVNTYFEDFARSFWTYFSDYIRRQRASGYANYAEPLETYIKRQDAIEKGVWPLWLTQLREFWW